MILFIQDLLLPSPLEEAGRKQLSENAIIGDGKGNGFHHKLEPTQLGFHLIFGCLPLMPHTDTRNLFTLFSNLYPYLSQEIHPLIMPPSTLISKPSLQSP